MKDESSSTRVVKWNTKNVGLRLGADAVSASCAAGLVAPLIAIIDQSVSSPSPIPNPPHTS